MFPTLRGSRSAGAINSSGASLASSMATSLATQQQISRLPAAVRAKKKIGTAAAHLRSKSVLVAFSGSSLDPTALTEQLRKNLDVKLTPAELGAIVTLFDKDGDGTVDCSEFMHSFFSIGREERRRELKRQKQENRTRADKEAARVSGARQRRIALTQIAHVHHSRGDTEAAMLRLAHVAVTFDRARHGAKCLEELVDADALHLTAFREQLRRQFQVVLTDPQLCGLFAHFDKNGDGTVSGSEFLAAFYKLGRAERIRRLARKREEDARRARKRADFVSNIADRYGKLSQADVDWNYGDADVHSAVAKVRAVAGLYDRDRNSGNRDFADASYDATAFREQLKSRFAINLSPAELGALFRSFDRDGNGTVDGAEFLSEFFRLGTEFKTAALRAEDVRKFKAEQKRQKKLSRTLQKFTQRTKAKIHWPTLPTPGTSTTAGGSSAAAAEHDHDEYFDDDVSLLADDAEAPVPVSASTADFLAAVGAQEVTIKKMRRRKHRTRRSESRGMTQIPRGVRGSISEAGPFGALDGA